MVDKNSTQHNHEKQTRARSEKDKQKQFEEIIQQGKKLFLEHGPSGFSMRQLGRELNMSPGNLYNYVKNKRELWFAIISREFTLLGQKMQACIQNHSGSNLTLIYKLGELYLDFAREDFDRFIMMHLVFPPAADGDRGPIEEKHQPETINSLIEISKQAIQANELPSGSPLHYAHFFNALVMGAAITASPIYTRHGRDFPVIKNPDKFFNFVKKQIQLLFQQYDGSFAI